MAAKGSVNKFRDPRQCVRRVGKDPVMPILYCGRYVGHGSYMSGMVNGKIVEDENGKPLHLRMIGRLISHEEFDRLYPVEKK